MPKSFNPNAAAAEGSGIYGLPYTPEEAALVLLPVPWEATTSYGGGTSEGPAAILEASKQVDLFDLELGNFFEAGIAMTEINANVVKWNAAAKKAAAREDTAEVNSYSSKVNDFVYKETKKWLNENKIVGLVGGDHSSPFGAIQAILEKHPKTGILHFDAHADLRRAYQGFEHSHASIMFNVLKKTPVTKLVQVGIRDFCEEEYTLIRESGKRVSTFFDAHLSERKSGGEGWAKISDEIVKQLPQEVYVSFDIDGLDPRFCPHTGTPVPGGLDFNEALFLIKHVVKSGRKIVGFDLNEVAPGKDDEWDANVGARLLYKMCGWALKK